MPRPPTSPTVAAPRTGPRERIVAAARRQFLAHGIRSVTMEELAGDLGMSKKTLYAHFPGKAELVQAILVEKISELEGEVSRIADDSADDFGAGLERLRGPGLGGRLRLLRGRGRRGRGLRRRGSVGLRLGRRTAPALPARGGGLLRRFPGHGESI